MDVLLETVDGETIHAAVHPTRALPQLVSLSDSGGQRYFVLMDAPAGRYRQVVPAQARLQTQAQNNVGKE